MRRFLFFLLLYSLEVYCQIYEYKDTQGNKIFSDHPPANTTIDRIAKMYQINTFQIVQTPTNPLHKQMGDSNNLTSADNTNRAQESSIPSRLVINSPTDQQVFWNVFQICIKISVFPALPEGYFIQVLLDGIPYKQPASETQVIIDKLPPGTHRIQAELLGPNKEILNSSQLVTIFIHHRTTSIGSKLPS